MRHRYANYKLGRNSAHRAMLERNFICSVIRHERVITTVEKAKALQRHVEKMISLGREKNLHNIRRAMSRLQDREMVAKLFDELGPRYKSRPGGYTRILRLGGFRLGDGGSKAIFELVDNNVLEQQIAAMEAAEEETEVEEES